jgi:sugar-specific transcriptional regulator TrmB
MVNLAAESLTALGLTPLEADIYVHLLSHSPDTGYGVAKALRKTAPNVYKAIETLEGKGALLVDQGDTRTVRAVPAETFLAGLEHRFARLRRDAANSLSRIPEAGPDARVYQIITREQLVEQCRSLLRSARRVVLVDAFPVPLDVLRDDLAATASRGVDVFAKIYAPDDVRGVEAVLEPESELTRGRWPEQWIDCVADASDFILGLLNPDGTKVLQAVRSASPYLAYLHHSRLACELGYTALKATLIRGESSDVLKDVYDRTTRYFALDAPGFAALRRRLETEYNPPSQP